MSTTTTNLGLFKYTNSDYELNFNFETALNNNWDLLDTAMSNKQNTLVSGSNIKTVNNNSLLGEGNISITGNLPDQTGKNGALLTTDGTDAYWIGATTIYSIIECYQVSGGTSGYNVYSNGLCEQWGRVATNGTASNRQITFLKAYADTTYIVSLAEGRSDVQNNALAVITELNSTYMKIHNNVYCGNFHWRTIGYLT